MNSLTLSIPVIFKDYMPAALLRFQYLYPDIKVEAKGLDISLEIKNLEKIDAIKQEVLHLIYKEKIYAETLEIRHSLYRKISNA